SELRTHTRSAYLNFSNRTVTIENNKCLVLTRDSIRTYSLTVRLTVSTAPCSNQFSLQLFILALLLKSHRRQQIQASNESIRFCHSSSNPGTAFMIFPE